MGKYETKKTKRRKKRKAGRSGGKTLALILAILLLTAALVVFVMPQVLYRLQPEEEAQMSEEGSTVMETIDPVEFPVVLEDGRVEIESLFPFSGVNPDAGKQEADDVAAIVLKNTSDSFLSEATVTAVLADGSERRFAVKDVPAGASAMAFSLENGKLLAADLCADVTGEAVFEAAPEHGNLAVSVAGMTVNVTNTSSAELNGIDVYYRDVFDGKYFGGTTYCCNIEKLSAGETMTFTAEESLLGVIEVVRVAVND